MFLLLNILWFFRTSKYVLFWLYLWQLKEYHIGRFADHFRTHKGKRLIFNHLLLTKIILAALFVFWGELFSLWFTIIFLIYLSESLMFAKGIYKQTIKKPQQTKKMLFLIFISFVLTSIFFRMALNLTDISQVVWILLFDIFTPVIVSIIVLLFQPFFVLLRNNVLRKAQKKMDDLKMIKGRLTVVGVTGSYGKTSTKEFLTTILSKKYKVLSTNKHQNSEIGIANCILKDLNKEHQIFIAEVGAYNKGKIKEVCNMVKPDIGIVTGVNEQHMALFGSMENLLSAEGGRELAKALPKGGLLVLNGDNKYCLDLYKKIDGEKKLYSLKKDKIISDIWTDSIDVKKDNLSFLVISKEGEVGHFNVKVLGKQNIQNILAAILIAKEFDMSLEEIAEACKNIAQEQAGMTLRKGKHEIDIIDSSYSSNPDGVFADLEYLKVFSQKKVIIMPCLIELGKNSAEIHQKIGRKIGEVCDLAIITSKDKFEDIKNGAIELGMKEKDIIFCENPDDIYSLATLFCKSGDTILLEGRVPKKLIELLVVGK